MRLIDADAFLERMSHTDRFLWWCTTSTMPLRWMLCRWCAARIANTGQKTQDGQERGFAGAEGQETASRHPRKGIAPTGSGRKTMEWISVKDRLPENEQEVWIRHRHT